MSYKKIATIQVSEDLYTFVNEEVIPGTGLDEQNFGQITVKYSMTLV